MRAFLPRLAVRSTTALALCAVALLLPATSLPLPAPQQSPADRELQRAMESAGSDRVALARNLEEYLRIFPDSPRRAQVYRAMVEVCLQLEDRVRAVDYAERFIAVEPDDSAMMLLASELLEELGDEHGLTRAVGYLTRILDRVEKEEPPADAGPEWSEGRSKLLTAVYLTRARLEITRRRYEAALADLQAAEKIAPTAEGRLRMAEVAELRNDYNAAVDHYVAAYLMPDTVGRGVDRAAVHRRLVNAWILRFGSEQGLEERIVAEFRRLNARPAAAPRPIHNPGLSDPFAFRLRKPAGGELAMSDYRGKLLVLHFWTTWSLPSREVQALFEQVAARFRGRNEVAFLALNMDSDETAVADYVNRARMRTPVAFADGLERLFQVPAVPMVLVISNGRVVHRRPGFVRERWLEELVSAVERNLARQ
jgi:tetratricopeptide (TPR) repeat protein